MTSFNESVDRSGMRANLELWPEQVKRSFQAGLETGRKTSAPGPRALVWAGMGGSAIGGDMAAALASSQASFPILVHRGGALPAWVGSSDRVLLVSFSGNTAETLAAAEEAEGRGAKVDLLTSGGQLEAWGKQRSITVWKVPGGRPPRAALGDLLGFSYGALVGREWCRPVTGEAEEAVEVLTRLGKTLGQPPVSDSHPLHSLVNELADRLPMVYGTGRMVPVARRWAGQVNENAKRPSHWGELPEMNHNEVVAYFKGSGWEASGYLVILADPDSPADVLKRIDITLKIAADAGWKGTVLRPTARTPFARMLELISTGDWLSYWLAIRQGVDPTPIAPIDSLKAALDE